MRGHIQHRQHRVARAVVGGLLISASTSCGASGAPASVAASPRASETRVSAAGTEQPPWSLCRPEVRGQLFGARGTADVLQGFLERAIRGLPLDEWMAVFGASRQPGDPPRRTPEVAQEIRRLHACPRVFHVESSILDRETRGLLEFDEPELGSLPARIVWSQARSEQILYLYDLEVAFVAARARRALLPFLARAPEWIPSGAAGCDGMRLALFRGPKQNVLCAVGDDRARCFAFAARPSGRLHLEIVSGAQKKGECAVGTNLVFGADLAPKIVPYLQYQFERNVPVQKLGGEPYDGTRWQRPIPRGWTELPDRFTEVDAASFPAAAAADLFLEELNREDLGAAAPPAIGAAELFCLRIDGAWRCAAQDRPFDAAGTTVARTAGGATLVSVADRYESSEDRFVHLLQVVDQTLVPVGRFPLGARSDDAPKVDKVADDEIETATSLVVRWRYAHEAPNCLRVIDAEATREIFREVVPATLPVRTTLRREDVAVRYRSGPSSFPAEAPAMEAPRNADPIVDLRGVWQLDRGTWTRVARCAAHGA